MENAGLEERPGNGNEDHINFLFESLRFPFKYD